MNTHTDKTPENKIQIPLKESTQALTGGEGLSQFTDNRPETNQLQQLQGMADQSAQVGHLAQLQAMANGQKSKEVVQPKKNNTGLPDNLKSGIENLSGISMDDVKVHRNSDKPAQLNAHAYAQGSEIHLASGQEKHLPHEAWHVVQQKQGKVKPTLQMKAGVNINDDVGLEKEADVMGEKARASAADHDLPGNLGGNLQNGIARKSTSSCQSTTQLLKWITKKSKSQKIVKEVGLRLGILDDDVEECYRWCETETIWEFFTANEESWQLYDKIKDGYSGEEFKAEDKINNDPRETALQLVEFIEQKLRAPKKKPEPDVEEGTSSGKVPEILEMGPSSIVSKTRPTAGNTLASLNDIDKDKWPSTYLHAMIQIHENVSVSNQIRVTAVNILDYNQGGEKETWECYVSIAGGGRGVVIHYHPRAIMPEGASSGESDVHVKGSKSASKHEQISPELLASIGCPSLEQVKVLAGT